MRNQAAVSAENHSPSETRTSPFMTRREDDHIMQLRTSWKLDDIGDEELPCIPVKRFASVADLGELNNAAAIPPGVFLISLFAYQRCDCFSHCMIFDFSRCRSRTGTHVYILY